MTFKDHFSQLAPQYAQFRPTYPPELFDYLAVLAPDRSLAWDCACGAGQASVALGERFGSVIATDASAQQIAAAHPHPHVHYQVAAAEQSGLPSGSVALVTVAQALHWFDLPRFYAEVHRVLAERGVLAVWTYGVLHLEDGQIDALLQHFYATTVGPYWPPERRLVEDGYRALPFPFTELTPPAFSMQTRWDLPHLLGYLRTWSATARYVEKVGRDPVVALAAQLEPLWSDPQTPRTISWPLALRIGREPD